MPVIHSCSCHSWDFFSNFSPTFLFPQAKVLSKLSLHPNIISYYDSFEVDGTLMIEMEYADGGWVLLTVCNTLLFLEQQSISGAQISRHTIAYLGWWLVLTKNWVSQNVSQFSSVFQSRFFNGCLCLTLSIFWQSSLEVLIFWPADLSRIDCLTFCLLLLIACVH